MDLGRDVSSVLCEDAHNAFALAKECLNLLDTTLSMVDCLPVSTLLNVLNSVHEIK